ncbi:MAG: PAS domain S-box protein, partial [Desulfobacterales bacterium]
LGRIFSTKFVCRQAPGLNARFNRTKEVMLTELTNHSAKFELHYYPEFNATKDICNWNVGIYTGLANITGAKDVKCEEIKCAVDGADHCVFLLTWKKGPNILKRMVRRVLRTISEDLITDYTITLNERDRLIDNLTQSRERYRALTDQSLTGVFIHHQGVLVYVNDCLANMLNYSPDEMNGKMFWDFVHTDDCAMVKRRELARASGANQLTNYEFRATNKGGDIKWLETFATIINYNGTKACMGNVIDLTSKKEAERALGESEEKYRSLVESTEDKIYLIDRDLRYLFINETCLSRIGLARDKVIGKAYSHFHTHTNTKDFSEKVQMVFNNGRSLSYECRSERDGRYFLRTLSPVKEQNGRTAYVTVISKDITDRRLVEEALQMSNEKLLKEHHQRIILSKRLIDLLEQDRHEIAIELHDHVGQMLTSLKIGLEVMDDQFNASESELASHIKAAKETAVGAIKDIKNISHGLKPSMLDALGLVASLRELFNEIQGKTDLQINFFYQDIPKRFAKEKELTFYRIAQEALNNIIKHAKAKNVFVNLNKKDGVLLFSVEDDGVGFDQDRLLSAPRSKGPLGLIIMQERAVQIGGEFILDSKMGKGTHVLVEIPI